MWLQKMVIKNLKPYRGRVEIVFGRRYLQGKHIYVIYGDNGFGKTSLLDAIYWGLFGKRARKTQLIFNDKEIERKGAEMFVELTFYDDFSNKTYTIFRKAVKAGSIIQEKLEVIIDGESITGDVLYKQDCIEEFLIPYEISKFFFFDAEYVKTLAREQGGEIVKDSVELLLGLKAIRESIEDLTSIKGEFERQRRKYFMEENNYREIAEKLENISKKLEMYRKRRERIQRELKKKREERIELRRELAESGIEEIKKILQRRDELESKLELLKEGREEIKRKLEELCTNIHLLILKSELITAEKYLENKLKKLQREKEKLRELSFRMLFLKRLLDELKCPICGKIPLELDIRLLSEELEKLEKNNPLISKELTSIDEEYSRYYGFYSQLKQKLENIKQFSTSDVYELRIKLREINEEINRVQKDILRKDELLKNIGFSLVSSIEGKISDLQREIGELEERDKNLFEKIEELEQRKKKLERELKRFLPKKSEILELEAKIDFIDAIKMAFKDYLDEMIEKRRNDIIKSSSEIFLKLTNKKDEYRGFEFSSQSNYKFQIVCKDGSKPNMDTISYGEMEVMALSFILGLNMYSQIKAPIITDTLFGRLSPYVQENIAKVFSEMDNQIILLVLKDDRPNGKTEIELIAPFFKQNICKEFIIKRDQIKRESKIYECKILAGD